VSRQARLLTAGQLDSLEREGYLLVPSLLEEAVVAPMRAQLDELVHQTLLAWDANPGQDVEERGVVHATLALSDAAFAPCREHPVLAEVAAAMLGPDWHLSGLELRAPLPGRGHQGLHPDYFPGHRTTGPWRSLSAMWCISTFATENGPLRVIPGSHRVARSPVDDLAHGSEMGPHPAEVKLVAPAGSLILFNNADLWHSGTFNYSPAPRLAVTAALIRGRAPEDDLPAGSYPARQRPYGRAVPRTQSFTGPPRSRANHTWFTPSTQPRSCPAALAAQPR
jgi:ectoine hydroxylase-related dioxygenase (phytanoyl-CoA dioxygenase family)